MYIISPKPLDTRGGRSYSYSANVGVYSVSQPAFSGTELIGAHIPTQGAVWIGQNWEQKWAIGGHDPPPTARKFPAVWASLGHKPHPSRSPRPLRSQAPTRSEPGSRPIRRGLRRALRFSKPTGWRPEQGLPGRVGAAGSPDATCWREKTRWAFR